MSRVAIDLGFIQIYWYSLMIALGLFLGVMVILREARRQKIDEEFLINLIFYGVIFAILGARIYYVLFNWTYYSKHFVEIFEIWNGGLAIHGAMIGGGLFTIFYSRNCKYNFVKLIDIIVVGLILGQAIGRWGNFFNQEAYGGVVSLSFLQNLHLPQFIIEGMKVGSQYHHPTFLYESLWNLVGFIILLIIRRRNYIKIGQVTATYMMWYGVGRLIIEGMRTDSLMLGSLRMAQLVSGAMIVVGVVIFFIKSRKPRFADLYNNNSSLEIGNDDIKKESVDSVVNSLNNVDNSYNNRSF